MKTDVKEQSINYDIYSICKEIDQCFKEKKYYAALSMTLSLIGCCAKKQFPDVRDMVAYTNWCNIWLTKYLFPLNDLFDSFDYPNSSWGFLIYMLRCSMFHNLVPDAKSDDYEWFTLDNFQFYVSNNGKASKYAMREEENAYTYGLTDDKGRTSNIKKIKIDLYHFIYSVLSSVNDFIKTNKYDNASFKSFSIEILN